MRVWHVALGSLALVALVLTVAMHRAANTGSESVAEPTPVYHAPASAAAPAAAPPASSRSIPVKPHALRVKPQRLQLGHPRVRSATVAPVYDPAPIAPGPPPAPDIPAPPDVSLPNVPGSDGPSPCETDPPKSLDECANMPTAGSTEACIQYRVDCYG